MSPYSPRSLRFFWLHLVFLPEIDDARIKCKIYHFAIGLTPLHIATLNGDTEIAEVLAQNGADSTIPVSKTRGQYPYRLARGKQPQRSNLESIINISVCIASEGPNMQNVGTQNLLCQLAARCLHHPWTCVLRC